MTAANPRKRNPSEPVKAWALTRDGELYLPRYFDDRTSIWLVRKGAATELATFIGDNGKIDWRVVRVTIKVE